MALRLLSLAALALLLCSGLAPLPARAQAVAADAEAKARLVLAFTRFVQWPAGSFDGDAAPLQLCVLHESAALAHAFGRLSGLQVNGRPLAVRFPEGAPLPAACHVAYVDVSAARAAEAQVTASDRAVLTIGSADGFASRGGMVEVVIANDALRFDVNLVAVQQAGLNVRPGALKLARHVRQAR